MKGFQEKTCPRCQQAKMKVWADLTGEEKFLAERLPLSATYTRQEREMHQFCPRCWHEEADKTVLNC